MGQCHAYLGTLLALAVGGCSVKPTAPADHQALLATAAKYAFFSEPGPVKLDPRAARDTAILDEAADLVRDNSQWGTQFHNAARFLDEGRTPEAKHVLDGLDRILRYGEVLSASEGLDPVCADPGQSHRRGKALRLLAHGLATRARLKARLGRDREAKADMSRLDALANLGGGQTGIAEATAALGAREYFWVAASDLAKLPKADQRGLSQLAPAQVVQPHVQAVLKDVIRQGLEEIQYGDDAKAAQWVVSSRDPKLATSAFLRLWNEFWPQVEELHRNPISLSFAYVRWSKAMERFQGAEYEAVKNSAATVAGFMVQIRRTETVRQAGGFRQGVVTYGRRPDRAALPAG